MRKFVALDCLVDSNSNSFRNDVVQNLRQAVLSPASFKPNIQQALKSANFKFHRTCSYYTLIQECDACEGQTLLMYWRFPGCESRATISMSESSCSSLPVPLASPTASQREKELRTIAQQTDLSCRHSPGLITPSGALSGAPSPALAVSPPASLHPPARSTSLLGSVCALLLSKQVSAASPKETSPPDSPRSEQICRICFGGESAERLVRPCSCRGTIAAVHRACLERWLLQAATSYCELCRHHYVVTRSHKWSWAGSACAWAASGRGRALAADAWRALALGAASVLGTARALHACDAVLQAGARRGGWAALAANLFSSLLIGIIGALNGLLTTWMLLKIQEHQASWRAWRDATLRVRVSLGDEGEEGDAVAPRASDATVVGGDATSERSTNVADPFMVSLPYTLPEP